MATIYYNVATDEFFVFRRMTRKNKLLKRFLENPQSLRYSEIETILLDLGFIKKQGKGSHVIFFHSLFGLKLVIALHNNDCLTYHKKEIAKIIIKLIT